MTMIVPGTKIADTVLDSGYTFQQELLFQALKREVTTGMLMTNPRYTGFPSFAKAVLNFLQDKKAPKTKKNLYNYLVKQGVYDKISWGKKWKIVIKDTGSAVRRHTVTTSELENGIYY